MPPALPAVVGVAADGEHRFSKPARPSIRLLAGLGVEGDAHLGVTVQHLSRIARDPLRQAEVDLSRLAEEVMAELRQAEPAREVEVSIAPGLVAGGDPALLRNLLQNLLGNAWKFTAGRAPARIRFERDPTTEAPAGMAAFAVADNGAGFEPAYASKLFRPFQRLHGADEYEGHGIGLATVRRIVERHGGSIRAEGGVDQGATFRFVLPACPRPADASD